MKTVQINALCGTGSTGKICTSISDKLEQNHIENYILYSYGQTTAHQGIRCSDKRYIKLQALKSKLFGNYGFNSKISTKKIIRELERIEPRIVHLHNIHGHDCNLDILMGYLSQKGVKVLWTFHDCWAFTGYCPHFLMTECNKWQNECSNCPSRREYSLFLDRSKELYNKKKDLISALDLTVITPSLWLADMVRKSFLANTDIRVINNGIDLDVFKPYVGDFREKYNLQNKKIVLGVSFAWGIKKGFDVFCRLSEVLPEDYQVVLVGIDDKTDGQLSSNIISIQRTHNQQELAEIYSAADVFVNPTREENYPTVNMEALACGTPVVTFDTGGSAEMIDDTCGITVDKNDFEGLYSSIIHVCENELITKESCQKKAESFDMNKRFQEYVDLYREVLK